LPADQRVEFKTIYRAREIVGGDFYRIEQLSPDIYGLLVADAIGHGIAAALYTMQLSMLWEDNRGQLTAPADFMRALNKRLHSLVQDAGFFCTATYLVYDATSGRIRCARAGHPSPVIFHGDLKTETIGHGESALGMWPDTQYTEFQAQLTPGATLLMFTDCATEIFDAKDNQLELDGLIRLVHDLMTRQPDGRFNLETLAEKLLEYSNQIHLNDDLTLITLRRQS
jgi:serine phosphatase RsbU (regulator of sigma subunit)